MRTTLLITLAMLGLSACHTVHGAGEDARAAGHAIKKSGDERDQGMAPRDYWNHSVEDTSRTGGSGVNDTGNRAWW